MLRLNQAALLFTLLLVMWNSGIVFAGFAKDDHRVLLVSKGDSVTMSCNVSTKNATEISWTKGRSFFIYNIYLNRTSSNFSSHRLKIIHELSSKLIIFNAQSEDEGLYTCTVTNKLGLKTTLWNLTLSEILKEAISLKDLIYILSPATGFLLCGIIAAFLLCRKIRRRTSTQDPVQTPPPPGETVLLQPLGGTAHRKNNKQRSQYMERLNSIYNQF